VNLVRPPSKSLALFCPLERLSAGMSPAAVLVTIA
jgi:hypothetical protein